MFGGSSSLLRLCEDEGLQEQLLGVQLKVTSRVAKCSCTAVRGF